MALEEDSPLDSILVQLGEFGKYQSIVFTMVCLAVMLHSSVHIAYVFTAMDLEYRCEVPECESKTGDFTPPWTKYAIPEDEKCSKYVFINRTIQKSDLGCSELNFSNKTVTCSNFVYKTKENSVLRTFEELHCADNLWKLTMVGTMNSVGQFTGLLFYGYISDRFGRKRPLVLGMVLCGIFGIIKTFVPSFVWFLVFETIEAFFTSGTYTCGFIIGVELVGPSKRVFVSVFINAIYAVGEILVAGSAWIFQDWRYVVYSIYVPSVLLLVTYWFIPESIRWNISKGRFEAAKETLQKIARFNNKEISESSIDKLRLAEEEKLQQIEHQKKHSISEVFKSRILFTRLASVCFCLLACTFLFFGLTLTSVSLAGNSYLDFILTSAVEIPAAILNAYLVDRIGRIWSLSGSFFLTAAACFGFIFIPEEHHYAGLIVYLIGKCGSTAAFNVAYLISTEVFPTPLRHSLMGLSAMFGKMGNMVAPQLPLLGHVWKPFPLVLFTAFSLVAGVLTFVLPETLNTKLPETIEEAVNLGRKPQQNEKNEKK